MLYKALKYPFFGAFMVKWQNPLSAEQQRDWTRATVKSETGGNIAVLYAASGGETKGTMILGHPMGKEAKAYFLKRGYTDFYREKGWNVILFDINGFGESSHGNFFYFDDIIAISQYAKYLFPGMPIGYHGISLGAQWATIALASDKNCLDFAIIESAATTLDEFWVRFPTAHYTLSVMNFLMPKLRKRIRMIDHIKKVQHTKSILFIYSENDDWVPLEMGKRYHANCNIPSELYTVSDAKHAEIGRSEYSKAYFSALLRFIEKQ